jgi:hypothetical protein
MAQPALIKAKTTVPIDSDDGAMWPSRVLESWQLF